MSNESQSGIQVTKRLAEFVSHLQFEDIPDPVVSHIKSCILDTIGCGIYGSETAVGGIVCRTVQDWSQRGDCRVWMQKMTTAPPWAALANGAMAGSMAYDDLHHKATVHAGCICLPAALAVAEDVKGVTGRDLITAIVAGYEAVIRVALAVIPSARLRGFHPASLCGGFGGAAAGSRILRFDPEMTLHALGTGGALCSGLMAAQHDSMVHGFQAPNAAKQGVMGAYLAKRGFRGVQNLLEEHYGGFCSAFADSFDLDAVTHGLGESFHAGDVGIKYYPTAGSVSGALDGISQLIEENDLERSDITDVTVRVNKPVFLHCGFDYVPGAVVGAQMSIQYAAAALLLDGRVGPDQFLPERIHREDIEENLGKISVIHDPGLDDLGQEFAYQTSVELRTADRSIFKTSIQYPKGSAGNPLTQGEVERKFREQVSGIVSPEIAETLIRKLDTLEDFQDIGALSELLDVRR